MKTGRRILLTLLGVALALAATFGVWYAVENIGGARQWAETRRKLEARGESLDAAHFIPPPVPDDQNLAMAPLFVRLYGYRVDPVTRLLTFGNRSEEADALLGGPPYGLSKDPAVRRPALPGSWETAQALDLAALQRYYRAKSEFPRAPSPQNPADDVLLALTRYTALLDELASAASSRPLTRFPINWTKNPPSAISLPHENAFQTLNSTLRLRACAELASGRTDDALRDITLGLHLCRAVGEESFLISNLVNVACLHIQLQPIWEGLAGRLWSASQLAELQTRLQVVDLIEEFQKSARGERALFLVPMLAALRESAEKSSSPWMKTWMRIYPHGWADRTVANACQWQQTYVIDCVNVVAHRLDASRIKAGADDIKTLLSAQPNALAKLDMPVYASVAIKDARAQTAVDEACAACALERYYLDHQTYPGSLGELVPAYLSRVPSDVVDGAPVRYETTPDGRYRLWEVGWDGRDDGGTVAWNKDGPRLNNEHGDWVWQYTPIKKP